ncbi:mucin-binding protein [Lactobacillus sp. PV034]|uniref:mucin-binding protein n=1 Tax=Lactobacillus sp. PV034 TaxID=2594495 RepID=UPI00223F93C0|nr:Rib/alpha-like domain-containing protein [Lactobacillus sp. PV034]QNQ81095.1 YSIRK-type signal peptide-containing protein [Lactobacillus sp. PV034]
MLSRRNYQERLRKMEQKNERFSIRKLSIGAASVLIGLSFLGFNAETTQAATPKDKVDNNKTEASVDEQSKLNIKVDASQSLAASSATSAASSSATSSVASSASSSTASVASSAQSSAAKKSTASVASKAAVKSVAAEKQTASSASVATPVKSAAQVTKTAATTTLSTAALSNQAGAKELNSQALNSLKTADMANNLKSLVAQGAVVGKDEKGTYAMLDNTTPTDPTLNSSDVSDWASFIGALNDANVGVINVTKDITVTGKTANLGGQAVGYNGCLTLPTTNNARKVTITSADNSTIDFGHYSLMFQNSNQKNGNGWDITLDNLTLKGVEKDGSGETAFAAPTLYGLLSFEDVSGTNQKKNTVTLHDVTATTTSRPIVEGASKDNHSNEYYTLKLSGNNNITASFNDHTAGDTLGVSGSALDAGYVSVEDGTTTINVGSTWDAMNNYGADAIRSSQFDVSDNDGNVTKYSVDVKQGATVNITGTGYAKGIFEADGQHGSVNIDGTVNMNMGTGRSLAIFGGNLNIGKTGSVDITTQQASDGWKDLNSFKGGQYGVISIGQGNPATTVNAAAMNAINDNGSLKVVRNSTKKTLTPLIALGSGSSLHDGDFRVNVNNGAKLDLQDGANQYDLGMIYVSGAGTKSSFNVTNPGYVNLQRLNNPLPSVGGQLVYLEGNPQEFITNAPIAEWQAGNMTNSPSFTWMVDKLDTMNNWGTNAGTGFTPAGKTTTQSGKGVPTLLTSNATVVMSSNQGGGQYNGTQVANSSTNQGTVINNNVHLNSLLNNFSYATPQRLAMGTELVAKDSPIKSKDSDLYEPEVQTIDGTTDQTLADLNARDGIKGLLKADLVEKGGITTLAGTPISDAEANDLIGSVDWYNASTDAADWNANMLDNNGAAEAQPTNPTGKLKTTDKSAWAKLTYKDGSVDFVDIPLNITAPQADQYVPSYPDAAGLNDKDQTTTPTFKDADGNATTAPADTTYAFTNPDDVPTGVTIDSTTGTITVPAGTTPGAYNIPVTVTYPDKSTDKTTASVTVDGVPEVQPIAVTDGKVPDASTGIKNYDADGKAGYPSKVEWTTTPSIDPANPGTTAYDATVTYPDGTTTTTKIPVTVVGAKEDGDHTTVYGPMSMTTFNGDPANTHKTTDGSATVTPSKFNSIVVQSDYNYDTGVYGKSKTYNLSSDGTTYVNADDPSDTFAADTISYAWLPDYTPNTNVDQFKNADGQVVVGDTLANDPIERTTTGYLVGNSRYRANSTLSGDALTKLLIPASVATTWHNQFINFYAATPVTGLTAIHNEDASIPAATSAVDESQLTAAHNAAVSSTEWQTKPDISKVGDTTGTVRINFTDGTHLDVAVPIKVTDNDADTYVPSYPDTTGLNDKPQTITPEVKDDKGNTASVPTGTTYTFTNPDEVPTGVTIDSTTGTITVPAGTAPGAYNIPVTVTYPDGNTDTPTASVTVDAVPEVQPITVSDGKVPDATTGIKNYDPTGKAGYPSKVEWTTTPVIDPTKPGTTDYTVTVTYPDGNTTTATVPVTVTNDAQIYTPKGQDFTVYQTAVPGAAEGIANASELPDGTTYTWKTAPDTTNPAGLQIGGSTVVPAVVTVNYPDGSSTDVSINVTVKSNQLRVQRHLVYTIPSGPNKGQKVDTVPPSQAKNITLAPGRYEYNNLGQAEPIYNSNSTWGTGTIINMPAPYFKGYTANPQMVPTLNIGGENITAEVPTEVYQEITYTANTQTGKISYVDSAGTEITSTPLTGKTDEPVAINPVAPENWKIVPGQDIPTSVTATDSGIPTVTVKIEHATKDVTDDPSQADKVKKTVTRTIDLNIAGKTSTYTTQSVTLHRTATEDLVTKQVSYGPWNTEGAKFEAVTAPAEAGYTVQNPDAAPEVAVTGDTGDSTVTFNYDADSHNQVINYVGPDGTVVKTYDVTGKTGETVDTNIQTNLPDGWVITDPKVTSQITFGTDDPAPINVNIKHGTKDVTDDPSQADKVKKTVTRTIDLNIAGKTSTYTTQSVTLHRTATEDLVTKQVSYGPWNTEGAKFEAVTAPAEAGYTVQNPDAAPEVAVTGDTGDSTVTFNYDADSHNQVINYVGPDGTVVKTYDVTGKTGETVDTNIQTNLPDGWVITDPKVTSQITFGTDDPAPINVNIKHGTKDVTDDPSQADKVNKTVTRTIDVDVAGKTSEYTTQSVTLHRTATEDLVTKEVTYGPWNTEGAKFEAVTAPAEAGYTVQNPDAAPEVAVTGDTADSKVTFNYDANSHTQVINYVGPDGTTVKTYDVTGKTGETVDTNIQTNLPEGWVITDKEVPGQIKFGTDDPTPITVNIKHGTKDVTDDPSQADKVKKTVTRTIDLNIAGKTSTYTTQSVTLHRTATEDLVTKEVTYGPWNTEGAKFDAVTAPAEAGYTVQNPDAAPEVAVTGDTADSTVTFNYDANSHTQVINYVGPDGTVVKTYDVTGKTGETVDTNIQSNLPAGWVITDPKVTSQITFGTDDPAPINVNIKHGTKDVTNDPDQADKVNKTVTRTIDVDVAGKTSTYTTQSVTLHRTATEDLVTKEVTYGPWNTEGAKFDAVTAPAEAGYTVSNPDAAPEVAVTGDTADSTVTFIYGADTHSQVINYVDKSGKIIKTYDVTGTTGATVDTNIQTNVPEGWVITDKTVPGQITFGSNTPAPINVTIEHGTKDVTSDPDQADKVNKTVTRTIDVDVAGKTSEYTTQSVTLHRTATEDLVTKEVTYGPWNTEGAKFDAVTAPAEAGYTVTNPDAAPEVAVTGDTADSTVTFNYDANSQTRKINFVDPDGKTVSTQTLTGKTGTSVTIGNGEGQTPLNIPTGYEIVPNTEVPTKVPFNADSKDNPDITVKVQAKVDTVDGRNDKSNSDVYRQVTRTITVNIEGQEPQVRTQTLDFYRIKSTNEATGKVTYTDWTSNMTDGSTSFPDFEIPTAGGYTRTITGGTITTKDGKDYVASVSGLNDGTPVNNINVTVNYTKAEQTATIQYVDNNDHNHVVGTQEVPGEIGETVKVNLEVPTNWKLVPNQQVPSEFTFGSTPLKDTIVYVEHGTKDVTPDYEHDKNVETATAWTVTETVNVTTPDGKTTKAVDASKTFTRTATKDLVTNKVTYGEWSDNGSYTFPSYNVKEIAGYTPSQASVPAQTVKPGDKDLVFNITYSANNQTRKINFVDPSGKTVGTQTLTGKTGTSVTIGNGSGETPLEVPTGYEIVPNTQVPSSVGFNATDNPDITVKVQAKVDTDDGRNDKGNSDVYRQVTETVTVNIEGQKPQVVTQTLDFYRIKSTNEATGKVTYTDWTSNMTDGSTSFAPVEIPSAAGYTRTITGGTITTKDGKDYVASVSGLSDGTPVNNINVTVNYVYSDQTATIKFVNNADHNDVVSTQVVGGKTGQTVPVKLEVPANWQVVGGQQIPSEFTFGSTPIKDTIVYVEHKTEDVTNDPNEKDNVNKTITRTVDVDVAGKTSEYTKQTVTLHRPATKDLVTNKVTYGAWGNF